MAISAHAAVAERRAFTVKFGARFGQEAHARTGRDAHVAGRQ